MPQNSHEPLQEILGENRGILPAAQAGEKVAKTKWTLRYSKASAKITIKALKSIGFSAFSLSIFSWMRLLPAV